MSTQAPPDSPPYPDETPPTAGAPPVVAVMVVHDPGPWLEESLQALAAQDYPDLSVLLIDAASAVDPTSRVAAVLPSAFVRRTAENGGYAASANEVMAVVEGATHFVFLHDDAAPEPDAIRLLVEEAYRSNAGVVAPKLVDWNEPSRLLAVGSRADKAGLTTPVGRGELDQEQHDAVRDVFVAPGGCTLVRADLFTTLGGFDASMVMIGEDLDLSWRAQLAGARVVVAPAAKVRHLEAAASGARPLVLGSDRAEPGGGERRHGITALAWRHRLRTLLKTYRPLRLVLLLPQLVVVRMVELVIGVATGRRVGSSGLVGAWLWNLRGPEIFAALRAVQRQRAMPDRVLRSMQTRSRTRLTGLLRSGSPVDEPTLGAAGRALSRTMRRRGSSATVAVLSVVAAVLLIGSRHLLAGSIPEVGELSALPDSPLGLLREFASGWRTTGMGSESPAPLAFALMGLAGGLLLGDMGLLHKVLVLGMVPVGVFGMFRLATPIGSWRSRLVAAVLYAAIALPYDALARGRWSGLVAYAAMPFVVSRLLRASGLPPFGARAPLEDAMRRVPIVGFRRGRAVDVRHDEERVAMGAEGGSLDPFDPFDLEELRVAEVAMEGRHHAASPPQSDWVRPGPSAPPGSRVRQLVSLAVLLALAGAFSPATLVAALVSAVGLALGFLATGHPAAGWRVLRLAGVAAVVAVALNLPWSLAVAGEGWSGLLGLGPAPGERPSFADLVRLTPGRSDGGLVGWAPLVAAALVLLVGRRWRFEWAARLWVVATITWAFGWASAQGWLGVPPPALHALLAPAAVALPLCAALGLAAFQVDLPGYKLGWRQVASVTAGCAAVVAVLPMVSGALDGRWHLPQRDFSGLLSWMPDQEQQGAFRVLWVGRPDTLPLAGWPLGEGLAYGTSRNGPPTVTSLWPGPEAGGTRRLGIAVERARRSETSQLGHLLAPMAVRYIAVPAALAPRGQGLPALPPPSDVTASFRAQSDLKLVSLDDALAVYENTAWAPARASVPGPVSDASRGSWPGAARTADMRGAPPVLDQGRSPTRFEGSAAAGDLYFAESASSRWSLQQDGERRPRRAAFGFANLFEGATSGPATLRYDTPPWRWAALGGQAVLWLGALRVLARGRGPRLGRPAVTHDVGPAQ